MGRDRRYVTLLAVVTLCLGVAAVAWAARLVVAWVSDLPSRIHVELDGEAVRRLYVDGFRGALTGPDRSLRMETLRALAAGVVGNRDAAEAVRTEFAAELSALSRSPDHEVAELAAGLLWAGPIP